MSERERLAAAASHPSTGPDGGSEGGPGADAAFDDIVKLAADLFDAPIAGVSLVDDERQWFRAAIGLDAGCPTPRDESICTSSLSLEPGAVLVVEDASADPRFAHFPGVAGPLGVRFYAGAVLTDSDGRNLGALCVVDFRVRPRPSEADLRRLRQLAQIVMRQLEASRTERRAREQQRLLAMAESMSRVGRWRVDLRTGRASWSPEVFTIYGCDPAVFDPGDVDLMEHHHPDDRKLVRAAMARTVAERSGFDLDLRVRRPDGELRDVLTRGACEIGEDGAPVAVYGIVQDVTEQKQALAAAERGRRRYKLLADNMADVVTRIRPDGTSSYISPAIESLLGYTPEDMRGRPAQDFVPEAERGRLLEAFAEMAAGRQEITLQHLAAHRDGRSLWVETRLRLVRDDEGRPSEIIAVIRDVSDRKRLEGRLLASEARARKVVDSARQAIVTINEQGRVIAWNPFAEATFGWSEAEVVGTPLGELIVPPEHREAHSRGMSRFLQTGEAVVLDKRIEVPAQRRDGEVFPIELAVTGFEGADGWEFTALMHDIPERKAQSEEFETSFHNASIGMALVTPAGGFSKVNAAFCAIIGYAEDEALALDFQTITHPDDLDADLEQLQQLLSGTATTYAMDKRYLRRDGSVVWVNLAVSLVRAPDGAPRHFIAQVQDLSARMEAQEALAQQTLELSAMARQLEAARDAAEAANLAKSEFLANMSHELRTPLNGVVGFSRLLAESPDLSPADKRRVQLVRGAGEALNSLINDVLDFSKLEAGAVQLEARAFNLEEMIAEAMAMVEPQAGEKRVTLQVAGDEGGVLVGDPYRLRQVLLNFLSNAVKFTSDGSVTAYVAVSPGGEVEDGLVRLRVSVFDEGVGIAPETIPSLFRRFSQADGSVTRTFGGTGLGLAISRELIELMDGRVGVNSELGGGSEFWFEVTLPRGWLTAERETAPGGRAAFPGRRVLVVDDVPTNRELFQEMLLQHGCETHLACDGAEAIEAVRGCTYDLVLMDVQMPVLDGLAATRRLRESGFETLPIVALTASGTPEQVAACMAAGMDGHLLKPLSPQELERALVRVFEQRPGAAALAGGPAEPAPADHAGDADVGAQLAFQTSMGAAFALKFVGKYQVQLAERFLDEAPAALQADAHKVVGSAGMLGLSALGEAARRLEEACMDGLDPTTALAEVRRAAAAAQATLAAWVRRMETAAAA